MSDGMVPESSLPDKSRPVIDVQFSISRGKWPFSPMFDGRIFSTLLSSECQQSTPTNLQMKPSVLLLKSHDLK